MQINKLHEEMIRSRSMAFAVGTHANLKVQWRAYLLFCNYYEIEPFKNSSNTLCLYAQFLSRSFKSVDSIKNYLNGIRILFLISDLNVDIFYSFEVKLTLKGLKRKLLHMPKQALPITLEILTKFYDLLDHTNRVDVTYWCLFLFAFMLMSRKSNLVPISSKHFDKSKQLCRGDITVFQSCLLVRFKWTKTIQFGNRNLILPLVAIPASIFCPVEAYQKMCSLNPGSAEDPAFFVSKRNKVYALTYAEFQKKLRILIAAIGLDSSLFSSHSFRRGGASLANQAGVPANLIQIMGDWKSDAYKRYIKCSITDRFRVSHTVRKFISNKHV